MEQMEGNAEAYKKMAEAAADRKAFWIKPNLSLNNKISGRLIMLHWTSKDCKA